MKYIFLLMFASALHGVSNGQITAKEVAFDYQIAYCVGVSNSTAWIGEDVVVMVEGELPSDRDVSIMTVIIRTFEDILSKYEEFTGLDDLPMASSFENKPVIEVVIDNCGAGGLASHGVLGMSTGTTFLDEFYSLVSQGDLSVPQVFLYELNRNFWLPGMDGFNGKFDWAMNDEPKNYGWWTVGMNNAQAYIIPKSLGIGLYYFGSDLEYWEARMVGELDDYRGDSQYDFDFGWRQSLMPWHNTESINDLMSGLIIYSYIHFGGDEWIKGFYRHIQSAAIPNRSGVFAYQECRDNIYKIWSFAADSDLIDFFENELRWVITDDAQTCVEDYLSSTGVVEVEVKNTALYPNPTSDYLTIESGNNNSKHIRIYDAQSKLVKVVSANGRKTVIDLRDLGKGLYWVYNGTEIHGIIKR